MSDYFGIDFGTTNTSVVLVQKDPLGEDIIFHLGEGGGKIPYASTVAIPKTSSGELQFGRKVRRNRHSLSDEYDIYLSMKSYLGTKREFILDENRLTALELTTKFLEYIKADIKKHHGYDITEASYSYPVDFSPEARRELRQASEQAGIHLLTSMKESTAGYLAMEESNPPYNTVMVLDWGGGTLDISLLHASQHKLEEHSVHGKRVGGDDIDYAFATAVHQKLMHHASIDTPFIDMSGQAQDTLLSECEKAKLSFSNYDDDYELIIYDYDSFGTKNITVGYSFFESIAKHIVQTEILPAIDVALREAQFNPTSLDAILITGGSSQIRCFEASLLEKFKDIPLILPKDQPWVVATGTARAGSLNRSFYLNSDVSLLLSDDTLYPVLEREKHHVGSQIPSLTFDLMEDAQEAHFIFLDEKRRLYARSFVPTKGYQKEKLLLQAKITEDQIAEITLQSLSMGQDLAHQQRLELNKLNFYYDLST